MLRKKIKIPENTLLLCFYAFLGRILSGNFGKLKCKIGNFPRETLVEVSPALTLLVLVSPWYLYLKIQLSRPFLEIIGYICQSGYDVSFLLESLRRSVSYPPLVFRWIQIQKPLIFLRRRLKKLKDLRLCELLMLVLTLKKKHKIKIFKKMEKQRYPLPPIFSIYIFLENVFVRCPSTYFARNKPCRTTMLKRGQPLERFPLSTWTNPLLGWL